MDIIGSYRKMILSLIPDNLKKQLKSEKGDLVTGIKYILLASVVVVVSQLILLASSSLFQGANALRSSGGNPTAALALGAFTGLSLTMRLLITLFIPLFMVLGSLLSNAIMYALAKLLGGKGSFSDQYYHFAIVRGGNSTISALLDLIPCVGPLVSILLEMYYLYPAYLIYRGVHQLSRGRAIALVAIPVVVVLLVAFVVALLFAASIASTLGGLRRA